MNEHLHDKALVLELKGDRYRERGKLKQAFTCYSEALELWDTRVELYDKLLTLHDEVKDNWTEDDFIANLDWSLRRSELLNPHLKRVHHRSTSEHKQVKILTTQLLKAAGEEIENALIEEIAAFGAEAVYPLIDTLLQVKNLGAKVK